MYTPGAWGADERVDSGNIGKSDMGFSFEEIVCRQEHINHLAPVVIRGFNKNNSAIYFFNFLLYGCLRSSKYLPGAFGLF
jgi:hypothetical protein